MNTLQVLEKLESNEITPELAYQELYKKEDKIKPGRRAFFIKMKIRIPDEPGVTNFLRILFMLPIPIIFARLGLRFASRFAKMEENEVDIDLKELSKLLKYSKNTRINVDTNDALVDIKFI